MKARLLYLAVLAFAFAQEGTPSLAQRASVQADDGSVAIGGSVSGSTITIGISYEKLEEAVRNRTRELQDQSSTQKQVIALLQEKLDLNQRQVRAALDILGEAGVRNDKMLEKLYRDVKILDIGEGTQQVQRVVVARQLFGFPRDD